MSDGYLDITALAVALRLSTGSAPTGAVATELTRLRALAVELVKSVPVVDGCPQAVKDEAVVSIVGHKYDGPANERSSSDAILRQSGAVGILRPWIKRGGARIA